MDLFDFQKSRPDLFPQFTLKDTLFLYYNCPQRDEILQLYSKHIQICFTISGNHIFHHGQNTWVSDSKKGLFLRKCTFLKELPPDYDNWEVLAFYLKDDYLRSIFDEFRPHLNLVDLPEPNEEMMEEFVMDEHIKLCFQSLIPYFGAKKKLPESILESKFKELLYNVFAHPGNKHILAYISRIVDRFQTPIWKVMEENFMYDLKVKEFANISNRSLETFKRDFKEYYGTSPGKWLTERRLNLAMSTLQATDKTVREIAFESGFINASHFSRVFKQRFGKPPTEFLIPPAKK